MQNQPLPPWTAAAELGLQWGGGTAPLLILGPPGRLRVECVKGIHERSGGGHFERVVCSADSVSLRTQLFGSLHFFGDPSFDAEPPVGAIHRAEGGTLFIDFVDLCNGDDTTWMSALIGRLPITLDSLTYQLDPSTRVIASIALSWLSDTSAHTAHRFIPQWLGRLFGERIVIAQPLQGRLGDISTTIDWLFQKAAQTETPNLVLEEEAKQLLLSHQWAGDYDEISEVMRSLVVAANADTVTIDACKAMLDSYTGPGSQPVDNYRRQECGNYAQGMSYIGRPVEGIELYEWIAQLARLPVDHEFDPWQVGLRMAKWIHDKYYYSADRIRSAIREGYLALCSELTEGHYAAGGTGDDERPGLRTSEVVLVNPLGPTKSSAAVLPHVAHLLETISTRVRVVPLHRLASYLAEIEETRVVLFCDDFAGTGQQIVERLVGALTNDQAMKNVCERRTRKGIPVALGVVLGISFEDALWSIRTSAPTWLPVFAHAGHRLQEQDRVFSKSSLVFPEADLRSWAENLIVNEAGRFLFAQWPRGFGNAEALVVTADNAPNDSLPLIWKSGVIRGMYWKALFERSST